MAVIVQVIVTGLAAGAAYGLVAQGYALVYQLTGVVHLALGELVGLSVFATLALAGGTATITRTNVGPARFAVSLVLGLALAVIAGMLTYLVVRPFLRRGSTIGWIGALVAVAVAIRGVLAATLVRESYVFPDPLPFQRLGNAGVLELGGGTTLRIRTFFVIAVGIALAWAASRFLSRTRSGKGLRALTDDAEGALIVGLRVDRLLAIAFGLAGGLAAIAAIAAAPDTPFGAGSGTLLGLKGLVAALLAGFGSPWRALAAGMLVGVVETGVSSIGPLGPAFRDIAPVALALVVLAVSRLGGEETE